jgi:hypothetical protein
VEGLLNAAQEDWETAMLEGGRTGEKDGLSRPPFPARNDPFGLFPYTPKITRTPL